MRRPRELTPPDGFAEFVAARSDALLRSAWLLTGDAGRAEDLLQTVLADLWGRWATIKTVGHPEAYARKALFTTYVSWWRRRWRSEISSQPPDKSEHGDIAAESANRDAVRRALARLSRQQRAIVVLRYIEDLTVQRTAEVLGCSHNTVKVQAFRALRILRTDPHLEMPATWRSRNEA
ncbi:SigE family RNA polymerase sigma factor [Micromonospora sp. CPCC 205546]|uniref:SigE family RNA polymerase sigma factor n=1 Tax=Micromonospora sp. CPCC 205546 TaxID=3122397 RepID=UPI002FF22851